MSSVEFDPLVKYIFNLGYKVAVEMESAEYTVDHLLLALCKADPIQAAFEELNIPCEEFRADSKLWLASNCPVLKDPATQQTQPSEEIRRLLHLVHQKGRDADTDVACIFHFMDALEALFETCTFVLGTVLEKHNTTIGAFIDLALENIEAWYAFLPADSEEAMFEDDFEDETLTPSPAADMAGCLVRIDRHPSRQPYIARDEDVDVLCEILCRKEKNNPLVLGAPGVGKTTLVTCGLTARLNSEKAPAVLKGMSIWKLNAGELLTGTVYRGQFEEKMLGIYKRLKAAGRSILFIDDFHAFVESNEKSGMTAGAMLKDFLEDPDLCVIAASSLEEYRRSIEPNRALMRLFHPLVLEEPSQEDALAIVQGMQSYYEDFHHVRFSDAALQSAVSLSCRYLRERSLPDKALDLLDQAGAAANASNRQERSIDEKDIAQLVSRSCRIPAGEIQSDEMNRLKTLEATLKSNVFGQDEAAEKIALAIQMSRAGLNDENKPIASYLFVGPTGVGKTEEVKVLARAMGMKLLRFDMSEYEDSASVTKLLGSSAGYVGYEDGGLLTNQVRQNPNSIVLFDEIEKAHPSVFNTLLQIMDEATLTDNKGNKADFRSCIVILTSNAGARNLLSRKIGFGAELKTDSMDKAVKNTFLPEFIGRLSGVIKFNHLTRENALQIAQRELDKLSGRLIKKHVRASFTRSLVEYIADKGFSPEKGARNIANIIREEVSPLFMKEILFGSLAGGGCVTASWSQERGFTLSRTPHRKKRKAASPAVA